MGVTLREVIPDGTQWGRLGEVIPDWEGLEFSQDSKGAGTISFNYPEDGANSSVLNGGMFVTPVIDGSYEYNNSIFYLDQTSGKTIDAGNGNMKIIAGISLLGRLEDVRWMPAIGSEYMDENSFRYSNVSPGAVIKAGIENYWSRAKSLSPNSSGWINEVVIAGDTEWLYLVDEAVSPTTSVLEILGKYQDLGIATAVFKGFTLEVFALSNAIEETETIVVKEHGPWEVTGSKYPLLSSTRYEAFPRAITLNNGKILAVWGSLTDHYTNNGPSKGLMSTSTNGSTWTTPIPYSDGEHLPVGISKMGSRVAMLTMTRGPYTGWISVTSTPETSWPQPTMIPHEAWGGDSWKYPADLIWLDTGTTDGLLIASSYGGNGLLLTASEDAGKTWKPYSVVTKQAFGNSSGPAEPTLTLLPDGRILCMIRNDEYAADTFAFTASWSSDRGKTWTEPVVVLSGHTGQPKVTVMPDGALMVTLRKRPKSLEWRLGESRDGGKTWTVSDPKLGDMMYGEIVNITGSSWLIGSSQNSTSDSDIFSIKLTQTVTSRTLESTPKERTSNVRFVEGLNLTEGTYSESVTDLVTYLLVVGSEDPLSDAEEKAKVIQWVPAPQSAIERFGYHEKILEVPEASTPETLYAIGQMYIRNRMEPRYSKSFNVVDNLYDRHGNRLAVPSALTDYQCGDLISLTDNEGTSVERVCAITLSWSSSSTVSVGLTLNDYFDDYTVEFDRRLKRLGG